MKLVKYKLKHYDRCMTRKEYKAVSSYLRIMAGSVSAEIDKPYMQDKMREHVRNMVIYGMSEVTWE